MKYMSARIMTFCGAAMAGPNRSSGSAPARLVTRDHALCCARGGATGSGLRSTSASTSRVDASALATGARRPASQLSWTVRLSPETPIRVLEAN